MSETTGKGRAKEPKDGKGKKGGYPKGGKIILVLEEYCAKHLFVPARDSLRSARESGRRKGRKVRKRRMGRRMEKKGGPKGPKGGPKGPKGGPKGPKGGPKRV